MLWDAVPVGYRHTQREEIAFAVALAPAFAFAFSFEWDALGCRASKLKPHTEWGGHALRTGQN